MTKPKDPTGCLFITCALFGVTMFLIFVGKNILEFVALIKWVLG